MAHRINKRSPLRRIVREMEEYLDSEHVELSDEDLTEWLCTVAVYLDRCLYRVENLQKRIERAEK